MKSKWSLLLATLFLTVLTALVISGQDTTITRQQFLGYLEQSRKITGNTSVRNRTVIVTSDSASGPWTPYSSWISETVLPDRSRIAYLTPRQDEYIHIGSRSFGKLSGGTWSEGGETIKGGVSMPAAVPGFQGPVVEYSEVRSDEGGLVVTIISKPSVDTQYPSKDSYSYSYYFDKEGVVFKWVHKAWNGRNWLLRTESFEYDPEITIEIPSVGSALGPNLL